MNLKEIRKSKGFTQKQIALKMAMEQTTYSKKENGKSPITDEEYKKLSEILETSVEAIVIEDLNTKNIQKDNSKNNSIATQIISLPKEALEIMFKYTKRLEDEINFLKKK